jgi:hypothetical protein
MTAREGLLKGLRTLPNATFLSSKAVYRLVDEHLAAYRAEVLREASEEIRSRADRYLPQGDAGCFRIGMEFAADHIDPDKESS